MIARRVFLSVGMVSIGRRMFIFLMLAAGLFASTSAASAADCVRALKPETSMVSVGVFSDMRYTEEHAQGYRLELWRAGDCLVGLWMAADGPVGDTPTGLIEQVQYEKSTGALAFQARLTMGEFVVGSRTVTTEPSKDLYQFTGILRNNALRGTVQHTFKNTSAISAPPSQKVTLKFSRAESKALNPKMTYAQWMREAHDILKLRGPKW